MSVPSVETESFFVLAALVSSAALVGSLHCVGMCGGLIAAAAPDRRGITFYQLGRLASYLLLGWVAGAFGGAALRAAWSGWAAWLATTALAAGFVYLGVRIWRGRPFHPPLPAFVSTWRDAVMRRGLSSGGGAGSAAVGFASAFLPCGWLYAFVLAAAAAGSPWRGAAVLFFFWAGTVPALTAAPTLIRRVLRPLASASPRLAGLLLVAAGLLTVGVKIRPLLIEGSSSSTPAGEVRNPESGGSSGAACH